MIQAILFDLDGTLLPMDQDVFLQAYLGGLAAKMAPHGYEPKQLVKAIWAGTGAMVKNSGETTNEQVFWNVFSHLCGKDTRKDIAIFDEFYRNEFQSVKNSCGYDPRASETIRQIRTLGFRIVLATNPLFPAIATQSRAKWAGLEPEDFEWITTYENSTHCKPNPDYYREILGKLDLTPEQCLMVGNDVGEDMIAEKLGMRVFLLTDCLINKSESDISVYPNGSFPELLEYIRGL